MSIIDVKVNSDAVKKALERGKKAVDRAIDGALEQGLDMVIADIRGNDGRLFSGNSEGVLTSELGRTEAKNGIIAGYWSGRSAKYGYVLERGPKASKMWEIKPVGTLGKSYVNARGKMRKAGDPIQSLRFKQGGGVVYRRKVTRVWSPSQLRPHWSWAWGRNVSAIRELIKRKVSSAVREAMHGH